ncbi:hypothetical protein [Rubinisphaera sp. JC750]|uniref:hypothetical protein n=1 Tax=Rubinisphaera sp. JC750 TaxID=2898658 RepID=UPI001F3FFD79|nr:hypothetical protein [Rubinisphaera sp. JC750]
MARRRTENADSLELLLDTICNMFGGIVFISLLVVLMMQTSPSSSTSENTPIDPLDVQKLQRDWEIARAQAERTRQARSQQLEFLGKYVPPDLKERLDELYSLDQANSDLEERTLDLQGSNLEKVAEIEETNQKFANSEKSLAELQDEVASLDSELKQAIDEHAVVMPRAKRLPTVEALQVSVRFNRLYFRHDLTQLQNGSWVPNLDDYVVTSDSGGSYEVQVKPTAGVDLSDKEAAKAVLRSKLKAFAPSHWAVSLSLWPESFAVFRDIREILHELGYRVTAITPDSAVQDRGGRGRMFQ